MRKVMVVVFMVVVFGIGASLALAEDYVIFKKDGKKPIILEIDRNQGNIQREVNQIAGLIGKIIKLAGYSELEDFVFSDWNNIIIPGSTVTNIKSDDCLIFGVTGRISYIKNPDSSALPNTPVVYYPGGWTSNLTNALTQIVELI